MASWMSVSQREVHLHPKEEMAWRTQACERLRGARCEEEKGPQWPKQRPGRGALWRRRRSPWAAPQPPHAQGRLREPPGWRPAGPRAARRQRQGAASFRLPSGPRGQFYETVHNRARAAVAAVAHRDRPHAGVEKAHGWPTTRFLPHFATLWTASAGACAVSDTCAPELTPARTTPCRAPWQRLLVWQADSEGSGGPPDHDTPVDLNVVGLQWAAGPPGFQKLRAKLLAEVGGNQINRLRCRGKKKFPAPDCLKPGSLLTS